MRVPGWPLLLIVSALQAPRSAGQWTATSRQWQGPFTAIEPPFDSAGDFKLPDVLQIGCHKSAINRIGLTISATDHGDPVQSPLRENILGIVADMFLVADVYSPFEFNFCVWDDSSNKTKMLLLYQRFVADGIDVLFSPSLGGSKWIREVEAIAVAAGARLFTWSLMETKDYGTNSLQGSSDFTIGLSRMDTIEASAAHYFPTPPPATTVTTTTTITTSAPAASDTTVRPPGGLINNLPRLGDKGGRLLASGATEAPQRPSAVEPRRGLFTKRRASREAPRKPGALHGLSYGEAVRSLAEQVPPQPAATGAPQEAPAAASAEAQVKPEEAEEAEESQLTDALDQEPATASKGAVAAGVAEEARKARQLQASPPPAPPTAPPAPPPPGERLNKILDLNFDTEWYTVGAFRLLAQRANATSVAFTRYWPDFSFATEQYCQKLKHTVRDLGYTEVYELIANRLNPTGFMDFIKSGIDPVVLWCTDPIYIESMLVLTKAFAWEPLMYLFPRPNVANYMMDYIPAFDVNYNIEPSNWPSLDEIIHFEGMAIYRTYFEWWSWHAAFTGAPPPLMSYQLTAAIQLYYRLLVYGFILDETVSVDVWDWKHQPIWTVNGEMRFDKDGLRLNATPAVRQLFPWPLDPNNLTLASFQRRYYASKSFELVASKAEVQKEHQEQLKSFRLKHPELGYVIWWLERHPVAGDSEIAEMKYPRPTWEQKEIEVIPCKTGCQYAVRQCQPCGPGNYRGAQDVICRQCQVPNTYADVKGLGKCRACPAGATCDDNARHLPPLAQPGFYKVDLRAPALYDSTYWTDYCGQWRESVNANHSRPQPDRGPLDQGPDPDYIFAECDPKSLCLGANECFGHNTGVLCSICKPNFSYRHLRVDSRVCEPCASFAGIILEMCGVATIFATYMVLLLSMSHFEVAVIDSIKAPMLLALMHHLHVQNFIVELLSRSASKAKVGVPAHASHIVIGMTMTRPFDLVLTDCLLNQYDPVRLIEGLLNWSIVAYISGLLVCCLARPLFFFIDSLVTCQFCRCCKRSSKGKQKSGEQQSEGARHFEQLHSGFSAKIGLLYALKRCLVWTLLYFPVLVRSAAQVFYCRDQGLDEPRLRMDISIRCGDPALSQARLLAIIILVGFGVGFPFCLFLLLRSAVEMDHAMIPVRRYLGMFFAGYKQRFFYWEVLKILRTNVIIISGIITDNGYRRTVILVVFLAFSFTEVSLEPHMNFHRSALPRSEALSSFSLCIIIVAGWVSSIIEQVQGLLSDGYVMRLFDLLIWVCILVEQYGDVLFLGYLGRALIFSLIVLPLHIANRTGARLTPFVRIFIRGGRWFFGCNSVGVVDGTQGKSGKGGLQEEMYLFVGALDSKELKVMKRGIGEVVHVAVHNYDKFHPALIVNAMDEAARRAGQARDAISMRRQQIEQHGWLSSILKTFMHEGLASSRVAAVVARQNIVSRAFMSRTSSGDRGASTVKVQSSDAGRQSRGVMAMLPTWSKGSKSEADAPGYFTVEELYNAMQDVMMDILDRNPLLKSVGDARGGKKKKRRRENEIRKLDKADLQARINTLRRTEEYDENTLFERLALEREVRAARKQTYQDGHHSNDNREGSTEVDFDGLYKGVAQSGVTGGDKDSTLVAEDLRRAVQEREMQIVWLRQRVEELASCASRPTALARWTSQSQEEGVARAPTQTLSKQPLPLGDDHEERKLVALLKPEANRRTLSLQPRELQETTTELLSPRNRHVTASGEYQEQAVADALVRRLRTVQEVDAALGRGTSPPRDAQAVAVAVPHPSPSPKAKSRAAPRAGSPSGPSSIAATPKSDRQPPLVALPLPPATASAAPDAAAVAGAPAPEAPEAAGDTGPSPQGGGSAGQSSASSSGGSARPGSGMRRPRKASWRDKLLAPRKASERSGPPTIPEDRQLIGGSARGPESPEAFVLPVPESAPAETQSSVTPTTEHAGQAQRNSMPNSARSTISASSAWTDEPDSTPGPTVPVQEGQSVWSSLEAREAVIGRENSRQSSPYGNANSARTKVPPLQLPT